MLNVRVHQQKEARKTFPFDRFYLVEEKDKEHIENLLPYALCAMPSVRCLLFHTPTLSHSQLLTFLLSIIRIPHSDFPLPQSVLGLQVRINMGPMHRQVKIQGYAFFDVWTSV